MIYKICLTVIGFCTLALIASHVWLLVEMSTERKTWEEIKKWLRR